MVLACSLVFYCSRSRWCNAAVLFKCSVTCIRCVGSSEFSFFQFLQHFFFSSRRLLLLSFFFFLRLCFWRTEKDWISATCSSGIKHEKKRCIEQIANVIEYKTETSSMLPLIRHASRTIVCTAADAENRIYSFHRRETERDHHQESNRQCQQRFLLWQTSITGCCVANPLGF